MEIYLLHGDHTVAILDKIKQLSHGFDDLSISRVTAKALTPDFMINNFQGADLFSSQKLIIIDKVDPEFDLEKLPEVDQTRVVLVADKSLAASSSLMKAAIAQNLKIVHFELPPDRSIFQFLDQLGSGDRRALASFDRLFEERGDQYLLTMIIFMLRRMLFPPAKLPPAIKVKIDKQRQKFGQEGIAQLYKLTLETDYKIKSGQLEPRLGVFLLCQQISDQANSD